MELEAWLQAQLAWHHAEGRQGAVFAFLQALLAGRKQSSSQCHQLESQGRTLFSQVLTIVAKLAGSILTQERRKRSPERIKTIITTDSLDSETRVKLNSKWGL